MNRILLLAALAISLGSLSGCVNREAQKQAKATGAIVSDPTTLVRVGLPKIGPITETLAITGAIVSGDDSQVGVKIGGRLTQVFVKDGDRVSVGQAIAQMETEEATTRVAQARASIDAARSQLQQAEQEALVGPRRSINSIRASEARLAQARANLARIKAGARIEERRQNEAVVAAAKVNLDKAKKDVDRYRNLEREGAVAKVDLDRAENTYAAALAQYERALEDKRIIQAGSRIEDITVAEQQVKAAEEALRNDKEQKNLDVQYKLRVEQARATYQGALEQASLARQALDDMTIRSPFSGTVSGKPLPIGTYVGPGGAVARVVGEASTYFEGEVPESQIASVVPGSSVDITLNAYKDKVFEGKVLAVNPGGSEVGRLFKVRVAVLGNNNLLKPGMFARGQIVIRTTPSAVQLPKSAILTSGGKSYVFVVKGDHAKRIAVTRGLEDSSTVEVTGLSPTQKVILQGQSKLVEGSKVRIEAEGEAKTEVKKEG